MVNGRIKWRTKIKKAFVLNTNDEKRESEVRSEHNGK